MTSQRLALDLPGVSVEVLPQIDSSNSELMRRARAGQTAPVLLVAQQQSAGRGRLGHPWYSGQEGLAFSLGMPLAPKDWSGLSLAVGVCVAQSLHPDLRLKWPNDIWWHERKLAGILIETSSQGDDRYVVVGVGINIQQPQASGLATPPAWLQELLPGIDATQALQRIAEPLVQCIKAFEHSGFLPFQASFNQRDALDGLRIALSDGTVGVAHGVDGVGALRLQTAQGWKTITSAQVSVRPSPAPLGAPD